MHRQNSRLRQDDRLIIGITGRIGAGKTSVGKYLESEYGFCYVRYSQVLSDWKAQSTESRAHLQEVGWEVMDGGMQQELNDRLIASIISQGDCAVDGLRHPIDFESLSRAFSPRFHLVCIQSSVRTRWERIAKRDPGKHLDLDAFVRADTYPVEQYIESLCEKATVVIANDGSREELYEKVSKVVRELRSGGES